MYMKKYKHATGAIPTPNGFYLDQVLAGKISIPKWATKLQPVNLIGKDGIIYQLWYENGRLKIY